MSVTDGVQYAMIAALFVIACGLAKQLEFVTGALARSVEREKQRLMADIESEGDQ